jgi:cysteinyl-tRNA synthetase
MRLYNTLTKNQENLQTLQEGKVGMYVCGPTVYASPHIGNARSVVIYDLLFRVLKNKYDVTYVRNITDVDDKINAAAKERGITIRQLTEEVTADFNSVMAKLGCLEPTHTPRATEHIAEMVAMIERLIAGNHAYVAEGHVLFDVASDKKYGHLSNRSQDEMIAGSRVEVAPYKRNPADFVLWKPAAASDDESAKFQSPWGVGRPGWHIECSAMSTKYLGNDFDIHGGGADLTFPHHENEVAQSCCANKGSKYAHTWVHNGFLTVNGEKMSKSLGNFITVKELLDKGVNGEVIRWALLSTHYRKPLDWTDKLLSDSQKTLEGFYRVEGSPGKEDAAFVELLEDDLNTSKAFAYLNEQLTEYNKTKDPAIGSKLVSNLRFLGFLAHDANAFFGRSEVNSEVENLINLRKEAKNAKNYAKADEIRKQLAEMGIVIEDKPGGITEWRKA